MDKYDIGKRAGCGLAISAFAMPYAGLAFTTELIAAGIPAGIIAFATGLLMYAKSRHAKEAREQAGKIAEMFPEADKDEVFRKLCKMGGCEHRVFTHHLENYDGRSIEELLNPDDEEVMRYFKTERLPQQL